MRHRICARPYNLDTALKVPTGEAPSWRWLLGRLRHRVFRSLAEVNAAIDDFIRHLNEERPIRRLGVTRRQLLELTDRPVLKGLPATPYVENHFSSVRYRFALAEVESRLTSRTIEVFHKGERIATHERMSGSYKHTTVPDHMPSSHRRYAGWTIKRIRRDAAAIGPATVALRTRNKRAPFALSE